MVSIEDKARECLPAIMNRCALIHAVKDTASHNLAILLHDPMATVTLAEYIGQKLIITANHVALELFTEGKKVFLEALPFEERLKKQPKNTANYPHSFEIPSSNIIENHECKNLDIAIFRATNEMVNSQLLKWFSIEKGIKGMKFIRIENPISQHSIPFLIIGFPNFSRAVNDQFLVSANFQVFGYLREIIDAIPGSNKTSHMIIEIDMPDDKKFSAEQTQFERNSIECLNEKHPLFRYKSSSDGRKFSDIEPLGGFSGGPILYLTPDEGPYLVGIITGGSATFGARIYGTPIDVLEEILSSYFTA